MPEYVLTTKGSYFKEGNRLTKLPECRGTNSKMQKLLKKRETKLRKNK